jgi:hypothetical protein
MDTLERAVSDRFPRWIPLRKVRARKSGSFRGPNFIVSYKFGKEEGRDFVDIFQGSNFSSAGITRLYEDGEERQLGYEISICPEGREAEAGVHNQAFWARVKEMGFATPFDYVTLLLIFGILLAVAGMVLTCFQSLSPGLGRTVMYAGLVAILPFVLRAIRNKWRLSAPVAGQESETATPGGTSQHDQQRGPTNQEK